MTPLVFVPVGVLAFGVLLAAGKSAADYLRPSGAHRKLPAARSAGTGAAPAKTPRPAGAAPLNARARAALARARSRAAGDWRRVRAAFAGWDVMQLISPHPEREQPRNGALLGDRPHLTVPVRPTSDAPPWAVVTGELPAVPDMLPAPETETAETAGAA